MKKIFSAAVFILSAAFAFSLQMEIPNRFIEIGFDADVSLCNNYFTAKEMLVKDLVIDAVKMNDELSDDGLTFSALTNMDFFINYNIGRRHIDFYSGFEGSGFFMLDKDIFEFLAKGTKLNERHEFSSEMNSDIFMYVQSSYGFNLFDFGVKIGAAFFLPVMHAELEDTSVSFQNKPNGELESVVSSRIKLRGCFDLKNLCENKEFNFGDFSSGMGNGWGFDMNFAVEHKIVESLQGRGYMRLPLVPGTLSYSAETSWNMTYKAEDFMDLVNTGGVVEQTSDDFVYGKDKMRISRPFRMGADIAWRPFGRCMTFSALLGFGVKYPWTNSAKGYVEYSFGIDTRLFNVLGFSVSSSYLGEVFKQQAGIMINARVLEIDAGVALAGGTLKSSFGGSGVGAYAGLRMGF